MPPLSSLARWSGIIHRLAAFKLIPYGPEKKLVQLDCVFAEFLKKNISNPASGCGPLPEDCIDDRKKCIVFSKRSFIASGDSGTQIKTRQNNKN
jgi:hypothetical protein